MTYKIEKNIPIEREYFPFADMEPGDSFAMTDHKAFIRACHQGRRSGYKITTRKQADGSYRIWLKEGIQA